MSTKTKHYKMAMKTVFVNQLTAVTTRNYWRAFSSSCLVSTEEDDHCWRYSSADM